MLHQAFNEVYTKFKLHFYQEIFRRFQDREASLTTVETFCMESIMALGRPTVNEFATFMCISPPNAAYKVNSLVKKGYIRKIQSPSDRREFHLEVTQKYIDYYKHLLQLYVGGHGPHHGPLLPGGLRQAGGDPHGGQPGADAGGPPAGPHGGVTPPASPLSSTASAALVFSEFNVLFRQAGRVVYCVLRRNAI